MQHESALVDECSVPGIESNAILRVNCPDICGVRIWSQKTKQQNCLWRISRSGITFIHLRRFYHRPTMGKNRFVWKKFFIFRSPNAEFIIFHKKFPDLQIPTTHSLNACGCNIKPRKVVTSVKEYRYLGFEFELIAWMMSWMWMGHQKQ